MPRISVKYWQIVIICCYGYLVHPGTTGTHPGAGNIHPGAIHICPGARTVHLAWGLMEWTLRELNWTCIERALHMNEFTLAFINCWYTHYAWKSSKIFRQLYCYRNMCMTFMMMLDITMEVSVNKLLTLKGSPQAWLGHFSWAFFFGLY